jgi:hypothetical protein
MVYTLDMPDGRLAMLIVLILLGVMIILVIIQESIDRHHLSRVRNLP